MHGCYSLEPVQLETFYCMQNTVYLVQPMFSVLPGCQICSSFHLNVITRVYTDLQSLPIIDTKIPSFQIRIEAWEGLGRHGFIVMDDLKFIQIEINSTSDTSSSTAPSSTSPTPINTTTTTAGSELETQYIYKRLEQLYLLNCIVFSM